MLRHRIILDSSSDATAVLAMLREHCTAAGLPTDETESFLAQVRGPLHALIESGRAVAAANGQFCAARRVETDSVVVTLESRFGVPPSLFTRLRKALLRGA